MIITISFVQVASMDTCHSKYGMKISKNIMEHASTLCHLKSNFRRKRQVNFCTEYYI